MSEHGWTRHGHRCCDQATGPRPAGGVARCGGPGLCGNCYADAAIRHSPGSGTFAAPTSPSEPAPSTPRAERLAQRFHEAYERLAPSFGYETREASAKPWADVPEQNRALMVAVCAELLGELPTPTPRVWAMPEIPEDVSVVRDRDGGRWTRATFDGQKFWRQLGPIKETHLWPGTLALLRDRGPLTEVEETNDAD